MKRHTHTEQKLVSEGRDILHAWALATPQHEDERCRAVAAFLRRVTKELPRAAVLPLFIGSAAFAAVMSLAREGRCREAGHLIENLEHAANLGDSAEGLALLRELRRDLATYYSGSTDDTDGKGFKETVRAVFRL